MLITRYRVRKAIKRYADAVEADSWKGGGDPKAIPEIETELKASSGFLHVLIQLIIPARGLEVERTDLR